MAKHKLTKFTVHLTINLPEGREVDQIFSVYDVINIKHIWAIYPKATSIVMTVTPRRGSGATIRP